ncbi:hypothetical protein [Oscillatoria sp. FACHB-1406]|uniref:hypothetical protein n=1 Tax=Oscillatoria sp. FACHB-1406 TaxID=2692846 RepID=UPI00168789FF|nr:hypothetical protein [Oscillatoria sp. FACHB-1406]MBD2580340.1 hypothetical protein [Oscillatoria sp. FACHB-1406]
MKLLPYETLVLETRDPLPIVRDRLATRIEAPRSGWNLSSNRAPYEGTISDDGFKITRVIHYRNSFLPVIRGTLESLPPGTVVRITMKLHPFVLGFVGFWCLAWYSAVIPLSIAGVMPTGMIGLFLLWPTLALVAFWGSFWYEANRSSRDLTDIIMGTG